MLSEGWIVARTKSDLIKVKPFFGKQTGEKWFQNHIMEKNRIQCLLTNIKESKEQPNVNRLKRANKYKYVKTITRNGILIIVQSTFLCSIAETYWRAIYFEVSFNKGFLQYLFPFFPSTHYKITWWQLSIIPSRNPLCIKVHSCFVCIAFRVVSGSQHYCIDSITE